MISLLLPSVTTFGFLLPRPAPLGTSSAPPGIGSRLGVGSSRQPLAGRRASTPTMDDSAWYEHLKFGGSAPTFDVIAKTKEYTTLPANRAFRLRDVPPEYFDDEYLFRGPVIGPINRADLVRANGAFGLEVAFPDLDRQPFGFCVDPDNPYRCMFFDRWTATHTGELRLDGLPLTPPTGRCSTCPAFPFSIVWTPEGKIIYEHLAAAVDRFEGNTKGTVAVFGLFDTAGQPQPSQIGNPFLILIQKIVRWLNLPAQAYSKKNDVPKWWKSAAVGAEANDM